MRVVLRKCNDCGGTFQYNDFGDHVKEVWCRDCEDKMRESKKSRLLAKKKDTLDELEKLTFEERIRLLEGQMYDVMTYLNKR